MNAMPEPNITGKVSAWHLARAAERQASADMKDTIAFNFRSAAACQQGALRQQSIAAAEVMVAAAGRDRNAAVGHLAEAGVRP